MSICPIMVVDDETVITMQLEEYLSLEGFEVVGKASSGEEAIAGARKLNPHLIIMDIVMPGKIDGIAAAEIIKKDLNIPVLFLTAYGADDLIKRAKVVEPLGYIIKPFNKKEMKATIEVAVHRISMDKQREQAKEDLEILVGSLSQLVTDSTAELEKRDVELQAEAISRKNAEGQSDVLRTERQVLLKEVDHRVKNNLQVISSLLSLQAKQIQGTQCFEVLRKSCDRVKSIALVHENAYHTENYEKIDCAKYVRSITNSLLSSYMINPDRISLKIDIDNVTLNVNKAVPCGLIINELVSNSLKHAFSLNTSGEKEKSENINYVNQNKVKGEICISLCLDNNKYTLILSDNGVGLPGDLENTKSLGLDLVETLTDQLDGTLELDRTKGAEFRVVFKAD